MPLLAALQAFVEDELARMPALIEQVRRKTADALRRPGEAAPTPAERRLRFDMAQALDAHAQHFCDAFVGALARRVRSASASAEPDPAPQPALPRGLALLDEEAHGTDIEIARCATLIASAAEWELRELQTFTSALCELPYVAATSNPLRPEAYAHALWQAVETLPHAMAGALMLRCAAGELADAIQRSLAAACTRLEAQGVQPALYRSAVHKPVEPTSVLSDLLDIVPAGPQAKIADGTGPAAADRAPSDSKADATTTELLRSLFDAIARSSQMHPALRALTGLLQGRAIDLARRDPTLLDNAGHALWQLLDRFAFQSATHPNTADPQLLAWVGFATELVARIQATSLHDPQLYRATVEQLDAYSAAQFNAQLQQAAPDVAALQRDDPGVAALEIASMDTVPADLLADSAPAPGSTSAAEWLDQQAPGGWYRLFLRGHWTVTRLLWHSDSRARWLFSGPYPQGNDAFARGALVRLRAEMLIRPFIERAVVIRAAESVRRRLSDPRDRS